jgi:hypothetical protein
VPGRLRRTANRNTQGEMLHVLTALQGRCHVSA